VACKNVKMTVLENNKVGLVLATITALDRDAGENASLRFSVRRCTPSNVTSLVVMTSLNSTSAVITAAASFHYKTDGSTLYECLVSVCDSGAVTSLCADDVIVRVHVTGVVDQRPRFDKPGGYYFTVAENQPPGTFVGK